MPQIITIYGENQRRQPPVQDAAWIYSIKNMGKITTAPKISVTKPFDRLYSRAEIASMNPRQYREYEASLKAYRDAYSIAKTERNARKRERAEGREEGRAEGRAEGPPNTACSRKAQASASNANAKAPADARKKSSAW